MYPVYLFASQNKNYLYQMFGWWVISMVVYLLCYLQKFSQKHLMPTFKPRLHSTQITRFMNIPSIPSIHVQHQPSIHYTLTVNRQPILPLQLNLPSNILQNNKSIKHVHTGTVHFADKVGSPSCPKTLDPQLNTSPVSGKTWWFQKQCHEVLLSKVNL